MFDQPDEIIEEEVMEEVGSPWQILAYLIVVLLAIGSVVMSAIDLYMDYLIVTKEFLK